MMVIFRTVWADPLSVSVGYPGAGVAKRPLEILYLKIYIIKNKKLGFYGTPLNFGLVL